MWSSTPRTHPVDACAQVAVTAMLWGAGTAVGEVPPYLISFSAAMAGHKAEALQEIEEVGGWIVVHVKSPRMRQGLARCGYSCGGGGGCGSEYVGANVGVHVSAGTGASPPDPSSHRRCWTVQSATPPFHLSLPLPWACSILTTQ